MPRTEDEMSGEYSLDDRKISDGKSPSKMSKEPPVKASGKNIVCKVFLLDGKSVDIPIDKNDTGRSLFDKVCGQLNLVETEYFGMTYVDDRTPTQHKVWLNLDKKVAKQKKRGDLVFEFALKFYPPDPSQLREDLTRWLVVMQVRRDLVSGRIPCTSATHALLGSYNVQADLQDYDPASHGKSFEYIRDMVFAPNQTPELLERIAELHRQHKGQEPYEADKNFLDNAKKLAMYGVDLHKAKDSDNVIVMVGVCCSGLLIFREKLRLNRFVWPKILKLSYKRNHFYIKIRPGEAERNETTMMFKLENHKLAKRLWKTCVEHHAFFRLREAEKPDSNLTFPRFGSKLRYSDNTLHESKRPQPINRPPPYFDQKHSGKGSQSHSVDNLTHGADDDSMYDSDGYVKKYPSGYKDGKSSSHHMGVPTAIAKVSKDGDGWSSGEESTMKRRPLVSESAEIKAKPPFDGNATFEHVKGQGSGDYMNVDEGESAETPEEAWQRRKREKEAYKKRKEEKKKEIEKKSASEDKLDKVASVGATQTASGVKPGSAALESGKDERLYFLGPPYDRDGFNEYGYDRDGFDRDGYDKDGYDRDDYDIKGRKKPYLAPFGRDGYNGNGYDKDGYDKDGYDKNAFDRDGYNKRGRMNPYGPPYDRYGFNENGFNKHGLDPDGYDKDGYDKHDLDIYGRKNPYAPPYDRDGYNENGFDKHGFDRDGFDKNGFDKDGYDRDGRKTPYGPPYDKDGYNKNGYDRDGFDRDGYNKDGYDRDGFDRDGYDKDGYDRDDYDIKGRKKPYLAPFGRDGYNGNGYDKDGYDRDGYDKNAFDRDGYNKRGRMNPYGPPYDRYGFNENGFNKHGLDPDGYDKDGYNKHDRDKYGRKNPYAPPYDRDGYNENGFDKHGFDRDGFDKNGFDKDGYDRDGRKTPYGPPYDRDGFNKNGFDKDGFSRDGYDKDGYDRDGFDRDGYDKDGYDRDDYDIKGRKKPYLAPFGRDGYNGNGYDKDGYDRDGYDKNAFDRDGYNKRGRMNPYGPPYDRYGFNENGFNKHGLDPDGYDKDGYDKHDLDKYGRKNPYAPPYDRDGYNENGFDKHGFDRDGFDKDGFDKDGYDREGRKTPYGPPYDRDGYNKYGYNRDGFDRDGLDKDGFDWEGYDADGYDRDGIDRQGKPRKAKGGVLGTMSGLPHGSDLVMGKVDTTGVVGEEKMVDNKVELIPISKPVRETKNHLKPEYSDNSMSFDPLFTSTINRSKVPPPVPPKGKYKTEKDGVVETTVEQRITISLGDNEDIDYDTALANAIRSVVEFNPDMSVERIECVQHIE